MTLLLAFVTLVHSLQITGGQQVDWRGWFRSGMAPGQTLGVTRITAAQMRDHGAYIADGGKRLTIWLPFRAPLVVESRDMSTRGTLAVALSDTPNLYLSQSVSMGFLNFGITAYSPAGGWAAVFDAPDTQDISVQLMVTMKDGLFTSFQLRE